MHLHLLHTYGLLAGNADLIQAGKVTHGIGTVVKLLIGLGVVIGLVIALGVAAMVRRK